jgi:DNA-binding IscR family transcriptional regulator
MQHVLRISEAASLGMHAAVFLAASGEKQVSTRGLARGIGVSEHHLSKVLQRLTKAGIIRDPEEISLLDVYEGIEGKFASSGCLLPTRVCEGGKCILGGLLDETSHEVRRYLETTRLSDLVEVYHPERIAGATAR